MPQNSEILITSLKTAYSFLWIAFLHYMINGQPFNKKNNFVLIVALISPSTYYLHFKLIIT